MFLFTKAVVCLVVALPAVAQSPRFATITIRPENSTDPRNMRLQILRNGDLVANAVPVILLLSYAYGVPFDPSERLSGVPDWAIRERYDIEGKTIATRLQDGITRSQIQGKIRGLLADRFRLTMRVENKNMSVYALTVSRGGPKLQKSSVSDKDCAFDTHPDGCHNFIPGFGHPLNAKAIDMDDLAQYVANWTDLPVVNRTSLRGLFTAHTEGWFPMRLPPPPPDAPPGVNRFAGLPTIFAVLGKLGLELHRQKNILPVYSVQRLERPATD